MALPLKRVKSIKWFAKIRDAFGSVNYEQFFYNEITPLRSGSFTKAFNEIAKKKFKLAVS